MKLSRIALCFFIAAAAPAWGAEPPADSAAAARAEVAPLLAEMGAAANAHDVLRHVGFYAHDPAVTLIFNGQAIVGWDAIRDKQAEWWKNGETDVVYTMQGAPDIRVAGPGLVITTIYMKSKRTMPNGEVGESSFAASALWQKRAEGWRVIYAHESTAH